MHALLILTAVAVGEEAKIGGTIENTAWGQDTVNGVCNRASWETYLRRADFIENDKDNGLNEPGEHEVFFLLTKHEPCS